MAMGLLELTRVVDPDGTVVLFPSGEVDPYTGVLVRDEALSLIASNRPVAVDVRDVTYLDPDCIASFFAVTRCLVGANRPRLELRNVTPAVMRRLTESNLTGGFRLESTRH
jgi:anti-anti-sigma regulatory factor